MLEMVVTGIIGALSGSIGAYVIAKRFVSPDKIVEFIDVGLEAVTNDTELQKKVYVMGVILGNGIKTGIGLKGGKTNLKDVIGMGIAQFISRAFGGQPQQAQTEQPMEKLPWQK